MLTSLSIKNYALIDNLSVDFNNGLTIITGETGAGKSILLGGLMLILGKRADLNMVKDTSKKCIIEAVFDIANYNLKTLFKDEDLDYEVQTIIRREILPSGKSRAFVNDSPVTLDILQRLSEHLIDIHSQHQTLILTQEYYQLQVIDALANNSDYLKSYKSQLSELKGLKQELLRLKTIQSEAVKEKDYNAFLLNELEEAQLVSGELATHEEEYEMLDNVESIKLHLSESSQLLSDDQVGILTQLRTLSNSMQSLNSVSQEYSKLYDRIQSVLLELDDAAVDIDRLLDGTEADPQRLQWLTDKINVINALLQKHNVSSVDELLEIKDGLAKKVSDTEGLDSEIEAVELDIADKTKALNNISETIRGNRLKVIPDLINQLQESLNDLGMPNAQFKIELNPTEDFTSSGRDSIAFLFSANKGGNFSTLKKSASGGELSRIMLSIKAILSNYEHLPTIMFDEIDTGVSGEISNKMGAIMKAMSNNMQVFAITHLPQIAAKGDSHFKVYKEDINDITQTQLTRLSHEDRIVEIAQMLSGTEVSDSAILHAKELLN
ncbi:DNA repair protein RecN [Winogradskyella sp. 3972H.M.0a.05]|uniref:DNA repair protein RecN n=1 Tax=Winogradskyella sp. 3972H.M.0a.05 TaxID=2950277 RepID=UPI00339651C0